MQTKAKENAVVTSRLSEDGAAIIFGVVGSPDLTLTLSALSEEVNKRARLHGLVQRISDRAAKATAEFPRDATPEQRAAIKAEVAGRKHASMASLVAHYNAGGGWTMAAQLQAPKPLDTIIIAALCEVIGKDETFVRAYVARKSEGGDQHVYLSHLATGKTVAPVVDRLRAAALSAGTDPEDDLLAMVAEEDSTPE